VMEKTVVADDCVVEIDPDDLTVHRDPKYPLAGVAVNLGG
jgi:hypothetical protein